MIFNHLKMNGKALDRFCIFVLLSVFLHVGTDAPISIFYIE